MKPNNNSKKLCFTADIIRYGIEKAYHDKELVSKCNTKIQWKKRKKELKIMHAFGSCNKLAL